MTKFKSRKTSKISKIKILKQSMWKYSRLSKERITTLAS